MSTVALRLPRLSRHLYEATGLHEVFNDSNIRLEVKSSPGATCRALSHLCGREGAVEKLNDSGNWKPRRALVVPHTFLYYFAEATASTDLGPHGVIDLELYTNIQVLDGNVVRLSPRDDDSPVRTFYLRLENEVEAEAWAQTIRETRFDVVRAERDAIRSAKAGITEQLVVTEKKLRDTEASLEASRTREAATVSELRRSNAVEARRVEHVQALLASARCGDGRDGDEGRSTRAVGSEDCAPVGGNTGCYANFALSELAALEEAIAERAREAAALKIANATLKEEVNMATECRRRDASAALALLNQERQRVAEEISARKLLEAELSDRLLELEETRAEREEARANLGVVAAACREAESKSCKLQEHRRVLAREVKALRVEQRRLSAALSCATMAASAAAATVATATATTASSGNRDRSSSTMSWTAGDGTSESRAMGSGAVWRDDAAATSRVGGVSAPGREDCFSDPPLRREDEDMSASGKEDLSDRDPARGHTGGEANDPRWKDVDGEAEGGSPGKAALQPWLRPTSLDSPSSPSGQADEPTSAESGATSPEVGSPSLFIRSKQSGRWSCSPWLHSPQSRNAEDARSAFSETQEPARESTTENGAAANPSSDKAGVEDDGQRLWPPVECGGDESALIRRANLDTPRNSRASSDVAASRKSSSAAATLPGESRFSQVFQNFSAGLREGRKARRKPLLGSLDIDIDAGDPEADDGGETDDTERDSRHLATHVDETHSAWTGRSTAGGRGSISFANDGAMATFRAVNEQGAGDAQVSDIDGSDCDEVVVLLLGGSGEEGEGQRRQGSECSDPDRTNRDAERPHPTDAGEGQATVDRAMVDSVMTLPRVAAPPGSRVESLCSQASGDSTRWRNSLDAVADGAVEAASKATESSANWFRKVGLRDAEDKRSRQDGIGQPSSQSNDTVGRGIIEATVESGRLAMAPAAAARRWEAKLKGSFVSITSGVRWGMS